MGRPACRACRGEQGDLVLDLGEQPACDYFPRADDPGPDPVYPLQMWLCSTCGLAQLVADPTVPEEPRGTEPAALVAQAVDAVERVARAGLLPDGGRVAEYGSPHGGSWLGLLAERGLTPVNDGEPADVVVDCFGLMHAAGPIWRSRRTSGQGGPRWSAAFAIPLPEHDRPVRSMERTSARPLCVLLDHCDVGNAGGTGFQPANGLALRALRRDPAARRHPATEHRPGP